MLPRPPDSTLFPYTPLFRSWDSFPPRFRDPAQYNFQGSLGRDARLFYAGPFWGDLVKAGSARDRSEEHTSELQSRFDLVCRLLLEKKKSMHSIHHQRQQLTL